MKGDSEQMKQLGAECGLNLACDGAIKKSSRKFSIWGNVLVQTCSFKEKSDFENVDIVKTTLTNGNGKDISFIDFNFAEKHMLYCLKRRCLHSIICLNNCFAISCTDASSFEIEAQQGENGVKRHFTIYDYDFNKKVSVYGNIKNYTTKTLEKLAAVNLPLDLKTGASLLEEREND